MKLIHFPIKKIMIHTIITLKILKIENPLSKDNLYFKVKLKTLIKIIIN